MKSKSYQSKQELHQGAAVSVTARLSLLGGQELRPGSTMNPRGLMFLAVQEDAHGLRKSHRHLILSVTVPGDRHVEQLRNLGHLLGTLAARREPGIEEKQQHFQLILGAAPHRKISRD